MPRTLLLSFLPLGLLAFLASATPVFAQTPQQEKRIALVVGNGNYAKGPLATAANDAGLIAQTLQAAGFDVIGARDLDGDTLRKSFRDFVQKAEASPSDTVAMVYFAGYGIQLAGENYFIPVDSTINHDTDIPIEGMRISDYTRQLASLPLKASIIVLDAARQQPFIQGGDPIAGGLALVDPGPNMLVAFNAAPGTVAPDEQGSYGVYAQSLAEMIRTGGLSLPEVFDRVRLRVSETSKGAQVPWDAQKIQAQFAFFDRAPDAPQAQGAPDQVAAFRDKPLKDLGAQDAFNAALERDTVQGYEDFLSAYAADPLSKRVKAILAARREAITWRRSYLADTPDAYWSYLRRYPRGPHAADARRRLAILTAPLEPPASFAMLDYDVPPPPPDEFDYVDRPVLAFGDPDFGFVPPPPPPLYYLPPPPPDFIDLAPPIATVGLFILPRPVFVPIPVFVRPPAHIVPPPNNVVFNNIHNTTVINTVINQPAAPSGGPGAAGRGGAPAPALPPAVAQRATLIQQGRLPVPQSAAINPAARPGLPGATPANVAPNALPQGQQGLPRANPLPVPGARGAPPAPPPAVSGTSPAVNPNARLAPSAAAPAAINPEGRGRQDAGIPRPPGAQGAPAQTGSIGHGLRERQAPPALSPGGPGPGGPGSPRGQSPGSAVSARPPAPPAQARPQIRQERASLPPPRAAAPPPHMAPPPPRAAAPMARPAAPPPMARPAPPPQMARPAPPPQMARPAAPPPMARAAMPPPMARAAAPPPRPAAPSPAAGKRCPPNVPHC
jgi:uncharacterized caspase-like protein